MRSTHINEAVSDTDLGIVKGANMISYDFSGQVVVVTGAARGVGRRVIGFTGVGASVIAADRDAAGLDETIELAGAGATPITADISSVEGAASIIGAAMERFGRLDVCVNNAAVAPHASLLEERVEVWDTVYAVNCRGTFLMTQAAARVLIEQGSVAASSTSRRA